MSREESGSHLGSIAFEGEDIRVDDEVDTSVLVVLAIRVVGVVGTALKDVMQGRRQKIDFGALSRDRRQGVQVVGGGHRATERQILLLSPFIFLKITLFLPSDQDLHHRSLGPQVRPHRDVVALAELDSLAYVPPF
jgi:hypothetical protein